MLGGMSAPAVTVNPSAIEKVSVPSGGEKVIVASLEPVASPIGISKTAVTMYWLVCVTEVPVRLLIITLSGITMASGAGGLSVSSVKVTRTLVVPWAAEFGSTTVIWFVA